FCEPWITSRRRVENIMKKQMTAVALATSLVAAPMGNYASADELAGLTLEKEMREMIQQNIIKGTADGKYLPKEEVTRQEFAAFLARASIVTYVLKRQRTLVKSSLPF